MPHWLHVLAWVSLAVGFASSAIAILDEVGHPQHVWIMNVVWPVTALCAGPLAVWTYYP